MKTKFFYSMILVVGLAFAGSTIANVNAQTTKKTEKKVQKVEYTCPEHPIVVTDKPGKCPKCGMALVEKKEMKMGQKKDMKMGGKTEMKKEMKTEVKKDVKGTGVKTDVKKETKVTKETKETKEVK